MFRRFCTLVLGVLLSWLPGAATAAADEGDAPWRWNMQAAVDRLFPDGVPRDPQPLLDALDAAARAGNADAQLLLAMQLDKPGHDAATRQQGATWMQAAADQGHPVALMHLATAAFAAGAGTEGVELTRRAAEAGDADAQYALGLFHLNGEGVPADVSAAIPWLTRAATQGHPGAQEQLAGAYWNGRGVARDEDEAYFWLLLAATERDEARAFLETAGEWIGPDRAAAAEQRAKAWSPAVE